MKNDSRPAESAPNLWPSGEAGATVDRDGGHWDHAFLEFAHYRRFRPLHTRV
jgi:hypothetical protein